MEQRQLTCIGCPMGCQLTVTLGDGVVTAVTGNTCKRGEIYARKEVTHPTRIVTSTVRVIGGRSPMVPVKTAQDIPKERIFDVMKALATLQCQAPIQLGDVLVENVAGTGVSVVACKGNPQKI